MSTTNNCNTLAIYITCQLFSHSITAVASFHYLTRDKAVTLIAGCCGADAALADVNDEGAGGRGEGRQTLSDRIV